MGDHEHERDASMIKTCVKRVREFQTSDNQLFVSLRDAIVHEVAIVINDSRLTESEAEDVADTIVQNISAINEICQTIPPQDDES